MQSGILALDTILSAAQFFVVKWSPELKRNQSRDLLRFLLCRFYDQSQGKLPAAQLTLAQSTLAHKLGLSRQWIGILVHRLEQAGWIECYAPMLEDGMRGSTIFRAGRMLKRLIIMLVKAKHPKTPVKLNAKSTWRFSPSNMKKRIFHILQKENTPPTPETLKKLPLLLTWMQRGKES